MRSSLTCLTLLAMSCASARGGDGEPDAFPGRSDGAPEADAAPFDEPDAGPSACDLQLQSLSFDFEGSDEGFVHAPMPIAAGSGVTWTFDHWERGSASASTTCPSGNGCFGTNLGGNYIQCQRAYLVSPPVDLSACGTAGQEVTLSLQHNYDFWTGAFGGTTWFDGGLIEVSSNGSTWTPANVLFPGTIDINPEMTSSYTCIENDMFYVDGKSGYVGSSGGWVTENITIPSSLASVTFQFRFVYASGVSSQTTDQEQSKLGTRPGWFVDDIRFQ